MIVLFFIIAALVLAAEPFWMAYWADWAERMKAKIK
jgi:hypothetical protein